MKLCDCGNYECEGHIREALTENELSRYNRLKEITDSKRLTAMLPAWCKPKAIPKPTVFVPGLPPKFPNFCTFIGPARVRIPSGQPENLREYIAHFERINLLIPCPTDILRVQSFG